MRMDIGICPFSTVDPNKNFLIGARCRDNSRPHLFSRKTESEIDLHICERGNGGATKQPIMRGIP